MEEALQCQRPTATARRQWAVTTVAEDVDHTANEVHEEPQEPVIDDVCANTQGFSSGPQDTSVLTN